MMKTHANKTPESKNRSVANKPAQRKTAGGPSIRLSDNRTETVMQGKLQEMANNGAQAKELSQFQAMTNPIQRVVTTGDLTTSDDHIKGNPKKKTKRRRGKPGKTRTQSSEEVIKRAQQAVIDGTAKHIDTIDNDYVYEVPRKNPKSKKAPRRFHKHRGGGDGLTHGFFEVPNSERGANSDFEFSDSESEDELHDADEVNEEILEE